MKTSSISVDFVASAFHSRRSNFELPVQLAVLDHELLRRVVDDDLDLLFFGVVELPGRRLEVLAGATGHHLDVLAADAPRACGSSPSPCCRRR
jgi:hypothetical protein